jgi:DNA polymerase III epsilon subunit-like protein
LLQPKSYEKRHFATNLTGAVSWHKTDPGSCVPSIPPLWLQQTSGHDQPATVLVFDVETTGFLHVSHRIVEFALRDLSGGKNCTFQTLINPERSVSEHAAKINKISTELVCKRGVPR